MSTPRRAKSSGSLYQRCEPRRGCPPLEDTGKVGENGKPILKRPRHTCRGAWVAVVELPTRDGGRRRKPIVRAKKADALAALRETRRELERVGDLNTTSPTLSVWIDVWWKRYAMKNLKVSNRSGYKSRIEQYIRPCLGRVRLDRLGVDDVHRLREYITDPPPKGRGLSVTTARGAHMVLSAILADALIEEKVTRNVAEVVKAPAPAVHKGKYLDSAQARELLASVDTVPGTVSDELAWWAVAIFTGARIGECLGITKDMIDFERGILTIAWQLKRIPFEHGCGDQATDGTWPCKRKRGGNCPQRHLEIPPDQEVVQVDGGLYLLRPKSRAGWREVPMVGVLRRLLEVYIESHPPGMHGLIFTRDGGQRGRADGRPIDPAQHSRAWDAALTRARLPDVNFHSNRRTCNSVLRDLGVPVDIRQKIIGHASAAVNEDVYTVIADVHVFNAMEKLDAELDWREPRQLGHRET